MIHNKITSDIVEHCNLKMHLHYARYFKMFALCGSIVEIDVCAHFMAHTPIIKQKHMLTYRRMSQKAQLHGKCSLIRSGY